MVLGDVPSWRDAFESVRPCDTSQALNALPDMPCALAGRFSLGLPRLRLGAFLPLALPIAMPYPCPPMPYAMPGLWDAMPFIIAIIERKGLHMVRTYTQLPTDTVD